MVADFIAVTDIVCTIIILPHTHPKLCIYQPGLLTKLGPKIFSGASAFNFLPVLTQFLDFFQMSIRFLILTFGL